MLNRFDEAVRRVDEEKWTPLEASLDLGLNHSLVRNLTHMALNRGHHPRQPEPNLPAGWEWLEVNHGGAHLDRRAA